MNSFLYFSFDSLYITQGNQYINLIKSLQSSQIIQIKLKNIFLENIFRLENCNPNYSKILFNSSKNNCLCYSQSTNSIIGITFYNDLPEKYKTNANKIKHFHSICSENFETGEIIFFEAVHKSKITSIRIQEKIKKLISTSVDKTVAIYDLVLAKVITIIDLKIEEIYSSSIINSLLICGGANGTIGFVDLLLNKSFFKIIKTPRNKSSILFVNIIKSSDKWMLVVGGKLRGKIHFIELPFLNESIVN